MGELALKEVSSPDWQIQEQGLDRINDLQSKGYSIPKETRIALARTFQKHVQTRSDFFRTHLQEEKKEEEIRREFKVQHPPPYGEYLVALAAWLSNMKVESSLPFIFQFMVDNTDYIINVAWPTYFGQSSFDFLLNKFTTKGTEQEKEMAIRVLSVWVVPGESGDFDMSTVPPLSEQQKQQLLPIFLTAIRDPSLEIRYLATVGLEAYVNDAEVRKVLQELSSSSSREDIKREAKRILKEGNP